jgi:hypothetical protein
VTRSTAKQEKDMKLYTAPDKGSIQISCCHIF